MAIAEVTVKMTELATVKAVIAELTDQRDRARGIAVQLEQQLAGVQAVLDRLENGDHASAGRDFGRGVAHAAFLIGECLDSGLGL